MGLHIHVLARAKIFDQFCLTIISGKRKNEGKRNRVAISRRIGLQREKHRIERELSGPLSLITPTNNNVISVFAILDPKHSI